MHAQLVTDHTAIAPGETIHLALRQSIDSGWHTYWRNPGDSGAATTIAFSLPAGWSTGPLTWPTPVRLPIGPLMDYGYTGEVLMPLTLAAPPQAKPGQTIAIKAQASFLVCQDVCIPEDATLNLALPVVAGPSAADPVWGQKIAAALAALPVPGRLKAAMTPGPRSIRLSVTGAPVAGGDFPAAYFFPYDDAAIDQVQRQTIERGVDGLTLTLSPGAAFKSASPPAALAGVLSLGDQAYEIDAPAGAPLARASGLGPPAPPETAAARIGELVLAAGLAFVGGLILNLMPCVFPVLAMKAAALARHAHEPAAARRQGLAFMVGAVAAFLGLAGVLIVARAAGEAVGWGFQLQSPPVVAALALVMLLVGLDLSGVFEVGAGLQALSGRPAASEGVVGALLTGALAVAVAAPCTAPFMAGAIGYALTQPPAAALAIFLALGLGMAAPFTLLAFVPGLLSRLPRPGPWMDGLKAVLAFPMYAAAAWLVWVFSQQAGAAGQARLLAAVGLTAFAAWLFGAAQRASSRGANPSIPAAASGVALGLAVAAAFWQGRRDARGPRRRLIEPDHRRAVHARAAGGPARDGKAGVRELHCSLVRHLSDQRTGRVVEQPVEGRLPTGGRDLSGRRLDQPRPDHRPHPDRARPGRRAALSDVRRARRRAGGAAANPDRRDSRGGGAKGRSSLIRPLAGAGR